MVMPENRLIKVLVISHMHPRRNAPINGIFVLDQNIAHTNESMELKVISPIPYVPRFMQNTPKRKGYRGVPRNETIQNIPIHYPRYFCLPGPFFHGVSIFPFSRQILPLMQQIITHFTPDILHAHAATPDGYAGLRLGKKFGIPTVCTLHGSDINQYPYYGPLVNQITKKVISETDQVIAVSKDLKKNAEKLAAPGSPIEVIYNGIDTEKFSINDSARFSIRKRFGLGPQDFVLIFIGYLKKDKGIRELIHSFLDLSSSYPHLHLFVVGDGMERDLVQDVSTRQKTSGQLHFIDEILNKEVPDFLNAADVLILPSYTEGCPTVIKEALACGKPVIASNVGGIPEVIQDGNNGLLIPAKDVSALTNAIRRCVDNIQDCCEMGKNSRSIVEENFTLKKNALLHRRVYQKLIKEHRKKD